VDGFEELVSISQIKNPHPDRLWFLLIVVQILCNLIINQINVLELVGSLGNITLIGHKTQVSTIKAVSDKVDWPETYWHSPGSSLIVPPFNQYLFI